MPRSYWSYRTAHLRCETCSHSSLIELREQSWLLRLICYAMKETRIRAKCSKCGALNAKLFHRRADNLLLHIGHGVVGATRGASKIGDVAKE